MTSVLHHLLAQRSPFVVLPAPDARSPREAAVQHGVDVAELVRTEVIVTSGGPVAVVIGAGDTFDLATARGAVRDTDARLATAAEIRAVARDCEPGSLPPLSHYLIVPVYVDASVGALEQIVFPAGRPSVLVCMRRADLFLAEPVTVAALVGFPPASELPVSSAIAPTRRIVLTDSPLVPVHLAGSSGGSRRTA
jgi:prolyl-tRNA editing enzyme YbaK/EbsC (Cys-tRNA(Pro) deacylase)